MHTIILALLSCSSQVKNQIYNNWNKTDSYSQKSSYDFVDISNISYIAIKSMVSEHIMENFMENVTKASNVDMNIYSENCKTTRSGFSYIGNVSTTINGDTCQHWGSQLPHKHTKGSRDEEFPEKNITLARNYCRNPITSTENSKGPWCYTTNPSKRWEYCLIHMCSEPPSGTHPECKYDRMGLNYQGNLDHTMYGHTCDLWVRKTRYSEHLFPDEIVDHAFNYCRNPNKEKGGPWCYKTGSKNIREYCMIHICTEPRSDAQTDCKQDRLGLNYKGKTDHTISGTGHACIPWISTSYRDYSDMFYNESIDEAFNYCRNPYNSFIKSSIMPWCFKLGEYGSWEYCLIHICSEAPLDSESECKKDRHGVSYRGKINYTVNGHACIPWISTNYINKDHFPDSSSDEAFNYCRNPSHSSQGPFCFYSDRSFESCSISICSLSDDLNFLYMNKTGSVTYVANKTELIGEADGIIKYMYPIIISSGTVLNAISICVFKRPTLQKSTTAFLLILLAFMDSLALLIGALEKWLKALTGAYLSASTAISCQIYAYIWVIVRACPAGVLIVITLERVITMVNPYHAISICTKRNSIIVLLVLFIIICMCYIPILFSLDPDIVLLFHKNNIDFTTHANCALTNQYVIWMDMCFHCAFPFIMMFLGNMIIIKLLHKTTKSRISLRRKSTCINVNSEVTQLKSLTIILLVTSFTYLFLTLPFMVYFLIPSNYIAYDSDYMFKVCSYSLECINNSINFFLYCASAKSFRQEFLHMMGRKRLCCSGTSNIITPSTAVLDRKANICSFNVSTSICYLPSQDNFQLHTLHMNAEEKLNGDTETIVQPMVEMNQDITETLNHSIVQNMKQQCATSQQIKLEQNIEVSIDIFAVNATQVPSSFGTSMF